MARALRQTTRVDWIVPPFSSPLTCSRLARPSSRCRCGCAGRTATIDSRRRSSTPSGACGRAAAWCSSPRAASQPAGRGRHRHHRAIGWPAHHRLGGVCGRGRGGRLRPRSHSRVHIMADAIHEILPRRDHHAAGRRLALLRRGPSRGTARARARGARDRRHPRTHGRRAPRRGRHGSHSDRDGAADSHLPRAAAGRAV